MIKQTTISIALLVQEAGNDKTPEIGGLFEPEPVTFSFDRPGWYIVVLLLLLLAVVLIIKWRDHRIKNAYRRNAIKAIKNMEQQMVQNPGSNFISKDMAIVRMAAMQAFGRRQVASLSGSEWLRFLESKGKNTQFTAYGDIIQDAVYQDKPADMENTAAIIELSKKWIKTHAHA